MLCYSIVPCPAAFSSASRPQSWMETARVLVFGALFEVSASRLRLYRSITAAILTDCLRRRFACCFCRRHLALDADCGWRTSTLERSCQSMGNSANLDVLGTSLTREAAEAVRSLVLDVNRGQLTSYGQSRSHPGIVTATPASIHKSDYHSQLCSDRR